MNKDDVKKKHNTRILTYALLLLMSGLLLSGCGSIVRTKSVMKQEHHEKTISEEKATVNKVDGEMPEEAESEEAEGISGEAYNGSGVPDQLTDELLEKYLDELQPADDEVDFKYANDYQGYDVIGFYACRDAKGYKEFFGYEDISLTDIKTALQQNTNISQTYKDFIYDYAAGLKELYPRANLSILYENLDTLVIDEVTPNELAKETLSMVGDVAACYIAEENRVCVLEDIDLSQEENFIILSHELTHAARKYRYEEQQGDDKIKKVASFYTHYLGTYAEEAIITNLMYELDGKGKRSEFYPMLCNYYRIIVDCIDYTGEDYFNHSVVYLIDKMDEFMGDDQYAYQIVARIDAQMNLRYSKARSVDFHDFQPVYEYLANMYFKKYITEDMTREEAEKVFADFYEEISCGQEKMTRKYDISEATFMPIFEEYVAAMGIAE